MGNIKRTLNKDYYIKVLEVIRKNLGTIGTLHALALAMSVDELEANLGYIARIYEINIEEVK